MLRRILVVGLALGGLALPASARALEAPPAAVGGGLRDRAPAALPAALPVTVAIFYYPWYATPKVDGFWEHWDQNRHRPPADVYSRFYPASGPYSSADPAVLARQMAEISTAGVDDVIVSWWGRGSWEDSLLPSVLASARHHHLGVALHLEPYESRSPSNVAGDLEYAASLGIRDVYVYRPEDLTVADWLWVRSQSPPGMRLFAGTQLVGFAAAAHFEGFYTYDFVSFGADKFARLCQQAHAAHLLCAPSVGPGFDGRRAGEPPVRDRKNGQTYDLLWTAALAASPDVVTITSFNEWGEGTQIEPAEPRKGYAAYTGAWGLTGDAAEYAYLARTAYWTGRARSTAVRAP